MAQLSKCQADKKRPYTPEPHPTLTPTPPTRTHTEAHSPPHPTSVLPDNRLKKWSEAPCLNLLAALLRWHNSLSLCPLPSFYARLLSAPFRYLSQRIKCDYTELRTYAAASPLNPPALQLNVFFHPPAEEQAASEFILFCHMHGCVFIILLPRPSVIPFMLSLLIFLASGANYVDELRLASHVQF